MQQQRGGHTYVRDELGQLASAVVARVRPNRNDREHVEDCWQAAYAAGLAARRAAERRAQRTSTHLLALAMQSAVYRLLHHSSRKVLREADVVSSA